MAVTNYFKDAVERKDVQSVRIMMKDSLLRDPTFQEFAEKETCAAGLKELYDAYDGKELKQSPSEWNKDYMDLMLTKLLFNFSHERIAHLKKIIRHLYPDAGRNGNSTASHSDYASQKRIDQENGNYIPQYAGIGGAVGAVAGGAAAVAVQASVVAGIAAGVLVGAVAGTAVAVMKGKK